jgi:hypothetical protein
MDETKINIALEYMPALVCDSGLYCAEFGCESKRVACSDNSFKYLCVVEYKQVEMNIAEAQNIKRLL